MPRAKRRCPQPGCDNLAPCATHKPPSAKRPSASARGYDAEHKAERERWWPLVATGRVTCRRREKCRFFPDTLIHKGQRWQLGHPDEDCPHPRAPEHVLCNAGAPGLIRGRRNRRRT